MNELMGMYMGFWILVIVVAIAWLLLPFAIFGTKDILRKVLREQQETNELLRGR